MQDEFAVCAIRLAMDQTLLEKSISATVFASEFCYPMWRLQVLKRKGIQAYGATASSFPAFQRLFPTLMTEGDRLKKKSGGIALVG